MMIYVYIDYLHILLPLFACLFLMPSDTFSYRVAENLLVWLNSINIKCLFCAVYKALCNSFPRRLRKN